MTEMDTRYKPDGVETRWQQIWEEEGLYNADPDPARESFAIAHPPPNVTGDLHLGHALQLSLADTIVRTRRMQGYNVLFQPGFDHAGISTQAAVEKHLATEGKTRQDLGREAFEARVWEWLREYGGKIMFQFRRIGASLDYRRERFTMDDAYVRAVMRFFVHLYRKGYIYRANRIINWCPFHLTSLSDLEVQHVDVDDTLTYVRYPLADGDGHITIATVRPATIVADVAVAVHPEDDRYRGLVGREVVVPYVERRVPVIADERVERDFGTGALKITPGHDPLDYDIGRDHGLEEITAIGPEGRMNEEAGDLAGLTQEEADERILAWLREHDQLEKRESYRHTVGAVRPVQDAHRAADLAAVVLLDGRVEEAGARGDAQRPRDVPSRVAAPLRGRVARDRARLEHLAADLVGAPAAAVGMPGRPRHGRGDGAGRVRRVRLAASSRRSTDVLDTWFSSALWPFATLGWPDDTEDLRTFYPGDLNTTARDIIRLWENRMIFSGLEMMGDVPFRNVVIHSLVHAPAGGRMSKSLGTGMNPLALIEAYGADATRYGLMKMASAQDVRFSEGAIEEGRKLANKLWNVSRLILLASEGAAPDERPRTLEEHWILARLSQTQREVERLLGEFDFSHLVDELYHLTFDDFCDWYAESIKPRLYDGDADARATAVAALERLLKLLHPAMPHVTEEIWTVLPERKTRLIVAAWPEAGDDSHAAPSQSVKERGWDFPPQRRPAARLGRRSGSGSSTPSCKPGAAEGERQRRGGARAAAQGDRARGEACSRTSASSQSAPREGRGGRAREARAVPP